MSLEGKALKALVLAQNQTMLADHQERALEPLVDLLLHSIVHSFALFVRVKLVNYDFIGKLNLESGTEESEPTQTDKAPVTSRRNGRLVSTNRNPTLVHRELFHQIAALYAN